MGVIEGKYYRHFKGGIYKVILIARDSEDQAEVVVYRSVITRVNWTRRLEDFISEVGNRQDNVTGQKYKFEIYEY